MGFSVEMFLFDTPLYEWIEITDENISEIILLFSSFDARDYEGYNPIEKFATTYRNLNPIKFDSLMDIIEEYNICPIECKRTGKKFEFYIRADLDSSPIRIMKIGQFPSLADFHLHELKRYNDRILPKERSREFSKAIGLAAHGIGIGSFVYLRRIFEYLIFNAFEKIEDNIEISRDDFIKLRMDERIDKLEGSLPPFLVENKQVYSILSKGIHELEENECYEYFPILRDSIEIILDELVEIDNKQNKRKHIEQSIKRIHALVKKPSAS